MPEKDEPLYDERSGKGKESIVPQELYYWNWGAAGLTWIWGMRRHVWFSLLALIPAVSIVMMVVLGLRGNTYAWRAQKWPSVEAYQMHEKRWRRAGIAFFIIHVIGIISTRYALNHILTP